MPEYEIRMTINLPILPEDRTQYPNRWLNNNMILTTSPKLCRERGPQVRYYCTREPGHSGPHVAWAWAAPSDGLDNYICEKWTNLDPDLCVDEGL